MANVVPFVVVGALATALTLALTGCAPATSGAGPSAGSSAHAPSPAKSGSTGGSSLKLVDVCSAISPSSLAKLLGRPYVETANAFHTTTSSNCDFEGAGGLSSRLDLNVVMNTRGSKADIDKALANLAEDGEHPIQLHGMGNYAGAVKDVVAALYGTTAIVVTDSNEPDGTPDLTTAELREVVAAVVSAAR
jgi:hypothetical protein